MNLFPLCLNLSGRNALVVGGGPVGRRKVAALLEADARERLEQLFDDRFTQWVALLEELRPLIQARVADDKLRHQIFEALSQWRWLDRLRADGVDGTRSAMLGQVGLMVSDPKRSV